MIQCAELTIERGLERRKLYSMGRFNIVLQKSIEQDKHFVTKKINTKTKKQIVFPNIYNVLQDPNKTVLWLSNLLKKHNLEHITTHGLRHTHCSLIFEEGASIKEVQYRLGHNDVITTLEIYAHVTRKTKAGTIDKFTTFLNEESDKTLTSKVFNKDSMPFSTNQRH